MVSPVISICKSGNRRYKFRSWRMDGAQEATLEQGGSDTNNERIGHWHGSSWTEKQFSTGLDALGNGYTEGFCSMVFKGQLQWLYGLSQNC